MPRRVASGEREDGARGALEAELCVLLNAGHKLPVFCFRKTMRELTQGRGKSDERGRAAGRTLFSASPSLAGWTCILFPRALEYSLDARGHFSEGGRTSHTSCAIGELFSESHPFTSSNFHVTLPS